jgi:hypothetical protein
MTPVYAGRVQTRLFLLAAIGVPWTLLIGWMLPRPDGASVIGVYTVLFLGLVVVALGGLGWDWVYIALQQYRWDKDWPTLLGLLAGIPEAITTYIGLLLLTRLLGLQMDTLAFIIQFSTMWLLIWLCVNGPMRVVFIRWRFSGGRLR